MREEWVPVHGGRGMEGSKGRALLPQVADAASFTKLGPGSLVTRSSLPGCLY
jgi:hypothetical protein